MKKITLLFSAVTLSLFSCSKDEMPSNPVQPPAVVDNGSLLKKITFDGDTYETYNYNGNKIVSIVDSEGYDSYYFSYTNNNITGVVTKDGSGYVLSTITNVYDSNNNQISSVEIDDNDYGTKEIYTHDSDGNISYNKYSGNSTSQTTLIGYGKMYFNSKGDVIKSEYYNASNTLEERTLLVYDSRFCPFNNITGYSRMLNTFGYSFRGMHNNLSKDTYNNYLLSYITVNNVSYTYNANNYPTRSQSNDGGGSETEIYTYQ